jgi:carbonic anhydrase
VGARVGRGAPRGGARRGEAAATRAAALVYPARVSAIDELLENNRAYSASAAEQHGDPVPRRRVAIVTCMDSRIDPLAALGLGSGEVHVLRNAGGAVTDDMIRSLSVSQRRLGTREVMVIHHTDCGMQKLSDDEFRAELQEATGMAPAFAIESFSDVEADVRQSVLRVRRSPFLPHRDQVRGFVYDVRSHTLREVGVAEG